MKWDVVLLCMPAIFIAFSIAWALRGLSLAMAQNPEAGGSISSLGVVGIACLEVMWLIFAAIIFAKF